MILFSVLVIILTFVFTVFYNRYNRDARLIRKIPGPKAWPIIGNSHNYLLSPEKLFAYQRSLPKVYGHVNQIHGINGRIVNLTNPEDIEVLLSSSQYNYKQFPYTLLSKWLGEGLLISNGNKWQQRRKMLTKSFHFNILKKFMITFVDETENLIKRVEEEVVENKTDVFDVFALISDATLRIMCETAMGISMHADIETVIEPYLSALHSMGDIFTKRLSRAWLQFESIFQLSSIGKFHDLTVSQLHKLTNKIIKERRNYLGDNLDKFDEDTGGYESNKKFAMLDLLLKNEKSGNIDNKGIREEVDTFLFEGHDTTAVAISFMIVTLANEPDIQDKIYMEMYEIFGETNRLPTTDDLSEMKYLECCIKEALRRFPSAPAIMRCLTKDTVLGGYTVPAKTTCFICIYDMHHRADIYPDPERFIPERFLPENSSQRHPYAFLPFSAGSRNCIGQKFALQEMKVVISALIRKFRLEPITKTSDLVYKTDIVLRAKEPMYVKFCLRK